MIINSKYRDVLLTNQNEYIARFKKSLYGRFTSFFIRTTKQFDYSDLEITKNANYIYRVNTLRFKRRIQATKQLFALKKYIIENRRVKEIIERVNSCVLSKVYLSVACIIKNEGLYIKEWVEFHRTV